MDWTRLAYDVERSAGLRLWLVVEWNEFRRHETCRAFKRMMARGKLTSKLLKSYEAHLNADEL